MLRWAGARLSGGPSSEGQVGAGSRPVRPDQTLCKRDQVLKSIDEICWIVLNDLVDSQM